MKASVLREKTLDELVELLNEEHAQLEKLAFNHAVSPLENPLSIRTKRRFVARLNTLITEKQAASQNA